MQQNHNCTMNEDEGRLLLKIYHSLYLKGLCVWEGVGERTELQYFDPYSYGHQRCVFLVLQVCSTGGPGAQLSAGWWLYLPHFVINSSDLQLTGRPEGPFYRVVAFSTTSCLRLPWNPTHWLPVCTELYDSSIAHSIFGMACLLVIKWK